MKKITNNLILLLLVFVLLSLSACGKKQQKHKWVEVDPISTGSVIEKFGVQTSKGSDPNAVVIVTAPVYIPLGLNEKGERKYDKVFVELEELKPEYLDTALKYYKVVTDESLFCDLQINDSDIELNAGPGADTNHKLNKSGVVRYFDLGYIDNVDKYKDVKDPKKMVGKIDFQDIEYCILTTFQENFQLVDCKLQTVSEEEYKKIHPDYE